MPQQLTDMQITRVSLVDKGANQKRIAVLKRAKEEPVTKTDDDGPAGIAAMLRKAADALLGKAEPVAKVETFASMIAGQALSDALYDSWWMLNDALWAAIYARDENGVDLALETKQALVAQDLDEFKAFLLAQMAAVVTKREAGPAEAPARLLAAFVAKVGRKISGSRLERLQSAAEALTSVLDEVQDSAAGTADDQEEENVEKSEIVAAMAEALQPIEKRLEALETTKIEKVEPESAEPPATLETALEAIGKLADRLNERERTESVGKRTSVVGQDAGDVKKRSQFAGLF